MADLSDLNRPIYSDDIRDCIDTLRENIKRVNAAPAGAIPLAQRGAANGVATLDAGTKIPIAQIPAAALAFLPLAGGTLTGPAIGPRFVATGTAGVLPTSVSIHSNGITANGPDASTYQHFNFSRAFSNGSGAQTFYQHTPAGSHWWRFLEGNPDSALRLMSSTAGSAPGTSLLSYYANQYNGILDFLAVDGTPGAETGGLRMAIRRQGVINSNGDLLIRRNPTNNSASVLIQAGGGTSGVNWQDQALVITAPGGGINAGMTLHTFGSAWVTNVWHSNGSLYCGTDSMSSGAQNWAYILDRAGNVSFGGNVTAYSDRKSKANVRPIEDALAKLLRLTGARYERIDYEEQPTQIGLVAQDVQAEFPEAVVEREQGLCVNYGALIAPIIEALRTLAARLPEEKQYGTV